jgi:hypothetical protein
VEIVISGGAIIVVQSGVNKFNPYPVYSHTLLTRDSIIPRIVMIYNLNDQKFEFRVVSPEISEYESDRKSREVVGPRCGSTAVFTLVVRCRR